MLIYGIIACFISSIVNLFLDLDNILVSVTLFGGIIFTLLYYLSIIKKQYTFPLLTGSIIFIFVIAPFAWIFNAGTLGGIPYYIIVSSSMLATLMNGFKRFVLIFCLITMTATLIVIEYKFPFLIKGYDTNMARLIDISIGLIITIISNALLFVMVSNNYNKEHKNVREYLTQLKIANEQLQREMTERKQAEVQLKYLATHDYLTGIPNRYSFEKSLKKAVAKAKRGEKSALLFIDIDNFKLVNDTKGHAVGDDLLISVANAIMKHLRESDYLARLGGDEFGVLLEGVTVDEARIVAEKLRQLIEKNEFCLLKYGCFDLTGRDYKHRCPFFR